MAGFDDPAFYGDRWASIYDEHHAGMDPAAAVEFLAGLAGGGPALELAIGTGRARFDRAQRVQTRAVTEDSAIIELSRHDAAQQRITTQIVTLDGQGTHLRLVALRYSWPSELDLMAHQAGLHSRERYSGWDRRPFDSSSGGHVSVYQLN